jgi:hypothetical protein
MEEQPPSIAKATSSKALFLTSTDKWANCKDADFAIEEISDTVFSTVMANAISFECLHLSLAGVFYIFKQYRFTNRLNI